jgi:hypothetical protein
MRKNPEATNIVNPGTDTKDARYGNLTKFGGENIFDEF